jgi:hypothetical protein
MMKRSVILVAAVVVALVVAARLKAQPPAPAPGNPQPQASPGGGLLAPPGTPQLAYPPPTAAPGLVQPQPPVGAACAPGCTVKVCVTEEKEVLKAVYNCRCKEFCLLKCHHCLARLLGRDCGCDCCEMRTQRVLLKKYVKDCPTVQCVIKEVPVQPVPCVPCPPALTLPPK